MALFSPYTPLYHKASNLANFFWVFFGFARKCANVAKAYFVIS